MMSLIRIVTMVVIYLVAIEHAWGAEPIVEDEISTSVIVPAESIQEDAESDDGLKRFLDRNKKLTRLRITAKVRRECWRYGVEDKHEHEAIVTNADTGELVKVDVLTLTSTIGGTTKDRTHNDTAHVTRKEKEYNMRCRRSCAKGTATIGGVSWSTRPACVD